MDNTAETPTEAAKTFGEKIRLDRCLFLHTTTGRCVTFAAGCAATFTSVVTQDVGLAATCAALLPPALIGSLIGKDMGTTSYPTNGLVFAAALVCAAGIGDIAARQNNQQEARLQSLPTMDPDKTITITARDRFCAPHQRGWIEVDGQKLNCGN